MFGLPVACVSPLYVLLLPAAGLRTVVAPAPWSAEFPRSTSGPLPLIEPVRMSVPSCPLLTLADPAKAMLPAQVLVEPSAPRSAPFPPTPDPVNVAVAADPALPLLSL